MWEGVREVGGVWEKEFESAMVVELLMGREGGGG